MVTMSGNIILANAAAQLSNSWGRSAKNEQFRLDEHPEKMRRRREMVSRRVILERRTRSVCEKTNVLEQ
jgi:hypothetical protein